MITGWAEWNISMVREYRGELCSNDRDFGRFPGLRWVTPLT